MPNTRLREHEWEKERRYLPFLTGTEGTKKTKKTANLDLFEKGLSAEIKKTDTIEDAVTKIVRMALCAEFGAGATRGKNAEHMVQTIVRGIMSDAELRKQALIIVDQFAK